MLIVIYYSITLNIYSGIEDGVHDNLIIRIEYVSKGDMKKRVVKEDIFKLIQ